VGVVPASSPTRSGIAAPGGHSHERRPPSHSSDYNYRYAPLAEHDHQAHRRHYGAWKRELLQGVARLELAALFDTAARHRRALSILYARRCLLELLHLLKEQVAEQPSPHAIAAARRLSVATLAAHAAAVSIGVAVAQPFDDAPSSSGSEPPQSRRTASIAHALSSFGPAGFIAKFIALLCSAPHQLSSPLSVGDGRRSGLIRLGAIVHTILLAERQRIQSDAACALAGGQFKGAAPIARHLLQGAVHSMLTLCRRDIDTAVRHAVVHTVEYIFDAFFAIDDSHAQAHTAALPATSAALPLPVSSGADSISPSPLPSLIAGGSMLLHLFSTPVCLLLLEVIAMASFVLSPSGTRATAAAAAGLSDDFIPHAAHIQCLERQRLVFVRLLARVLTFRVRIMQSSPLLLVELHRSESERRWSAVLHAKCAQLQSLSLSALEDESLAGRGSMSPTSFPHTFLLQALIDLALVWTRYERAWEALRIPLPEVQIAPPTAAAAAAATVSSAGSSASARSTRASSSDVAHGASPNVAASAVRRISLSDAAPVFVAPAAFSLSSPVLSSSGSAQSPSLTCDSEPSGASPLSPLLSPGRAAAVGLSSSSAPRLGSSPSFSSPSGGAAVPDERQRTVRKNRDDSKARWFKQLVLLDEVLTFLRQRPRRQAPPKLGSAPSPLSSPAPSPQSSSPNAPAAVGDEGSIAAIAHIPTALPSDSPNPALSAGATVSSASVAALGPRLPLSLCMAALPASTPSPSLPAASPLPAGGRAGAVDASLSADPPTILAESGISDSLVQSAPPPGRVPSDVPLAFVEIFWDRLLRNIRNAQRTQRLEDIRRQLVRSRNTAH
jgi:hypothetical protein